MERGADTEMLFVDVWNTLIDVWRADFTEAAGTAADAIERARNRSAAITARCCSSDNYSADNGKSKAPQRL